MVTIIPIIALQTNSLIQASNGMHDQIKNRFSQLATDETKYMTDWARGRLLDVKTLASMEAIQKFDRENANNIMFKYRELWGQFESFALIKPDRITDINTDKKQIDVHDRVYFKDTIIGKEVISDPLISRGTGHVIVVNAVPATSSSGQILGVVIGNVPITQITNLLAQLKLGDT